MMRIARIKTFIQYDPEEAFRQGSSTAIREAIDRVSAQGTSMTK